MKTLWGMLLLFVSIPGFASEQCPAGYDHEMRKLHSQTVVNLCQQYQGKPMLIVNTASFCGYTGQLKTLEALHNKYKDRGLVVAGFSSNDFRQEAESEEEVAKICYKNFGVSFDMYAPTHVRGTNANPLYQELNRQAGEPQWNFFKYLVDRQGRVVQRYASSTSPTSPELENAIESLLN